MSHSPSKVTEETGTPNPNDPWVANRRRLDQLIRQGHSWSGREKNCFFLNTGSEGGGRFANVSAVSGFDFPDDGRGLALVDWDHDGDLDVWLTNRTAPRVRFLRNDTPSSGHHVTFALVGTKSNRDAIGARLEIKLADEPRKLIRTLRAGEGFLSQSSKTLHVGLGDATQIESLRIRWPSGVTTVAEGLTVDTHYHIVEGQQPKPSKRPVRKVSLSPSTPAAPSPGSASSVLLTARLPLPSLAYTSYLGKPVPLNNGLGKPILLSLWGSWCDLCFKELKQFDARRKELEAAGLQVVAVSVDKLDNTSDTTVKEIQNRLKATGYRAASGLATEKLVATLQVANDTLFAANTQLPVPTSVLLHPDGSLAAIYRGPVEVDRVLADVKTLKLSGEQLVRAAQSLPGTWFSIPGPHQLSSFTRQLIDEGLLDDAISYIHKNSEQFLKEPKYSELLGLIGYNLSIKGRNEEAIDFYRAAIRSNPPPNMLALAQQDLGITLQRLRKHKEAEAALREAVRLDPRLARAHLHLGVELGLRRATEEALIAYQTAVKLNPSLTQAWVNLGATLASTGKTEQAIASFQKALQLNPEQIPARLLLGEALAKKGDHVPAAEAFRLILKQQPQHARANLSLAILLKKQGHFDQATDHLRRTVASEPGNAAAYYHLGILYQQAGKYGAAITAYRTSLRHHPGHVLTQNNLAWLLATSPEPSLRNGAESVRLAENVRKVAGTSNPNVLDTLAAAYAEAGQFDMAVQWQSKAVECAPAASKPILKARLELFRARKPYREKPES